MATFDRIDPEFEAPVSDDGAARILLLDEHAAAVARHATLSRQFREHMAAQPEGAHLPEFHLPSRALGALNSIAWAEAANSFERLSDRGPKGYPDREYEAPTSDQISATIDARKKRTLVDRQIVETLHGIDPARRFMNNPDVAAPLAELDAAQQAYMDSVPAQYKATVKAFEQYESAVFAAEMASGLASQDSVTYHEIPKSDSATSGPAAATDLKSNPLDFDQIDKVLTLARRLANESYFVHMEAVSNASPSEKDASILAFRDARDNMVLADSAYTSHMSSRSEFAQASGAMVMGEERVAKLGFAESAVHMGHVADKMGHFADRVAGPTTGPRSQLFGSVLNAAARLDHAVGRFEDSAITKVDGFVKGLKAFATLAADFGKQIASTPDRVAAHAKERSTSISKSTVAVARGFMSRVAMVGHAFGMAKDAVKESAWGVLNDSTEYVKRNKDALEATAKAAATTVERHARATTSIMGGVTGGLMGSMVRVGAQAAGFVAKKGAAVATEYRQQLAVVDAEMAAAAAPEARRPKMR